MAIPLPPIRGRNGWDDPITGPDDLASEVLNFDLYEGGMATKRAGATHVSTSTAAALGAGGWNDATVGAAALVLARTLPGQVTTGSVLLLVGANSKVYQVYDNSGSTAGVVTLTLAPASDAARARSSIAALNGKAFVAVETNENRLQVLSGLGTASPSCRRSGLKTPAGPAVADQGAGSYPAVLRWYRIAWREVSGSRVVRESLLGSAAFITPSGTGASIRVTQPAVANEGETHWAIFGSDDDADYYELAQVAIGTTTYDDNESPADYNEHDPAPLEGRNVPFPSVKFLRVGFNRLIGFGRHATTAGDSILTADGTIYFSPPRGADDLDVEEVIRNTVDEIGWVALDENADGIDRALVGPVDNRFYAFKDRGIYALIPTDQASAPFRAIVLTRQFGAVSHESTLVAEDEAGRPATYFLDPRDGPRRIGSHGLEWLGKDVADLWATVNHAATTRVAHGLYVPARKQIWWWIATGTANAPNTLLVYDVTTGRRDDDGALRGGWVHWSGFLAGANPATGAISAVLFPQDLESLSSVEVPTVAINGSLNATVEAQATTIDAVYQVIFGSAGAETPSNAAGYQGTLTTKAYGASAQMGRVTRLTLLADAAPHVAITARLFGNTGESAGIEQADTVSLSPDGTATQVLRRFPAIDLGQMWSWQVAIGDRGDTPNLWTLHRLWVEARGQERV